VARFLDYHSLFPVLSRKVQISRELSVVYTKTIRSIRDDFRESVVVDSPIHMDGYVPNHEYEYEYEYEATEEEKSGHKSSSSSHSGKTRIHFSSNKVLTLSIVIVVLPSLLGHHRMENQPDYGYVPTCMYFVVPHDTMCLPSPSSSPSPSSLFPLPLPSSLPCHHKRGARRVSILAHI